MSYEHMYRLEAQFKEEIDRLLKLAGETDARVTATMFGEGFVWYVRVYL